MKIRASQYLTPGQVLVAADYEHPETPMFDFSWGRDGLESTVAPVPDGRIIYCHPDDEQRLRDLWAVAQERPAWWEEWARFERLMGFYLSSPEIDVIGAAEGIDDWLEGQT